MFFRSHPGLPMHAKEVAPTKEFFRSEKGQATANLIGITALILVSLLWWGLYSGHLAFFGTNMNTSPYGR